MADNFLERREREIQESGTTVYRRSSPSLETLLLKNRSHREFDTEYELHRLQLEAIVRVNTLTASGMNAQPLRFKLVDSKTEGFECLRQIKIGGALPEPGLRAAAGGFIAVCSTEGENPIVDIDLGISLQSMTLKATEMGLGSVIIRAFDSEKVKEVLGLPCPPLAILAVGKATDKVQLTKCREEKSLKYWRENGVHYVPKLELTDILL